MVVSIELVAVRRLVTCCVTPISAPLLGNTQVTVRNTSCRTTKGFRNPLLTTSELLLPKHIPWIRDNAVATSETYTGVTANRRADT